MNELTRLQEKYNIVTVKPESEIKFMVPPKCVLLKTDK